LDRAGLPKRARPASRPGECAVNSRGRGASGGGRGGWRAVEVTTVCNWDGRLGPGGEEEGAGG
jgi:hypothetical protein